MRPTRTLLWAAFTAGLTGLAISCYLTAVHAAAAPLACATGGLVDCERVLSSSYGVIAGTGLPTSAAGIVWFAVSAALAAVQLATRPRPRLLGLHLAWAGAGLLTVLGLVYVEIDRLGAICAWCTAAHVLVLLSFLALLTARQLR